MTNKKATLPGGSANQNDLFCGNHGLDVCDYKAGNIEKQVISSGAVKRLTNELTSHLIRHQKVVVCKPCRHCKKGYGPQKIVSDLKICHKCIESARTGNLPKQNRFIAGVLANFEASLRRQIALGVM